MDQPPESQTMEVLVIVAFPQLETRTSEEAWEQDIVDAVSAAVYGDKMLDTLEVRPLEYEDCEWVFDGGMPMPDYDVTVGQGWIMALGPEIVSPKPGSERQQFAVPLRLLGREGPGQEIIGVCA